MLEKITEAIRAIALARRNAIELRDLRRRVAELEHHVALLEVESEVHAPRMSAEGEAAAFLRDPMEMSPYDA